MSLLTISGSPHVHGENSVEKIMYGVIYAMIPAMLISVYFFGLGAIKVLLFSVAACIFFEWFIQKYLLREQPGIKDGSAIVTGILLAFNVPGNLPVWIILIGAFVSIGIAKMSFGGLGKNPFNPALVGRVFLLISFPVQMTSWPKPQTLVFNLADAVTGPTPLGSLKEGLRMGKTVSGIMEQLPCYGDQLMGNIGGSLGEVSAVALLLGGLYMLYRKIITWHIPLSYIGSVVIFTGILWLVNKDLYADPFFHLLTGGLMLGAWYMATDLVTSPMSGKGQLLFGLGCGMLTVIIRVWGAFPEGVSFAILIMNAFVPLINKGLKPMRFGEVQK